jgi:hypothetical protein
MPRDMSVFTRCIAKITIEVNAIEVFINKVRAVRVIVSIAKNFIITK